MELKQFLKEYKNGIISQDLLDCQFAYKDIAKFLGKAVVTIRGWAFNYWNADLEIIQKSGVKRYFSLDDVFSFYLLNYFHTGNQLREFEIKSFFGFIQNWLFNNGFYPSVFKKRILAGYEITILTNKIKNIYIIQEYSKVGNECKVSKIDIVNYLSKEEALKIEKEPVNRCFSISLDASIEKNFIIELSDFLGINISFSS